MSISHAVPSHEEWGIPESVAKAYTESLVDHIRFVQEAGLAIGVSPYQLGIHDASKWSKEEYPGYAMHFKGGGAPDAFAAAWLHHIHHNPHHWQSWIFPDSFVPKDSQVENGVVEMPQNYALEMVADWMGSSMAYTGSWDMSDWLSKNLPKVRLHSKTVAYLASVLQSLGYEDIVGTVWFAGDKL